jgi:hypothetical protein
MNEEQLPLLRPRDGDIHANDLIHALQDYFSSLSYWSSVEPWWRHPRKYHYTDSIEKVLDDLQFITSAHTNVALNEIDFIKLLSQIYLDKPVPNYATISAIMDRYGITLRTGFASATMTLCIWGFQNLLEQLDRRFRDVPFDVLVQGRLDLIRILYTKWRPGEDAMRDGMRTQYDLEEYLRTFMDGRVPEDLLQKKKFVHYVAAWIKLMEEYHGTQDPKQLIRQLHQNNDVTPSMVRLLYQAFETLGRFKTYRRETMHNVALPRTIVTDVYDSIGSFVPLRDFAALRSVNKPRSHSSPSLSTTKKRSRTPSPTEGKGSKSSRHNGGGKSRKQKKKKKKSWRIT